MTDLVVLVLEQEAGRKSELEKELSRQGYGIRYANDGSSLLREISTALPHLIILDLDLPSNEGMILLKTAHDMCPSVPIIGETSTPTVEAAVDAMRRGAYNYTSKWGPTSVIADMISHALGKERMQAETAEKAKARRIRTFDNPASLAAIDQILSRSRFSESHLISYLQDIQKELNYLPQDALRFLAKRVSVSLPRVYGIATFYKAFSLTPRGRHMVQVCMGTACHVRGGGNLLQTFERELGVKAGATTYDNRFSLESVRCVGCCGLAPVFIIDGKYFGKITQDKVQQIIARYE